MAEPIKPQTQGLPRAKETPILQKQESPSFQSGQPNFQSAFSSAAFSPNALAELGNKMSLNASLKMAQDLGIEYGKTPEGDLLPPITKTDKAFVDAYSSQAEVTLGLQVQSMLMQANQEMAQQYRITPDMIKTYASNMAQGISETLKHAPNTIKPSLEAQFANQLMQTTHRFTMNMIEQDKQIAKQKSAVWHAQQLNTMHNLILDDKIEDGAKVYNDIQRRIKNELSAGMINPQQAYTLETESKLNFYSSMMIQKAIDARSNKRVEGFLASLPENKPKELTWGEWEHVYNATVAYVGALENLQNRNDSLIVAQANARASLGPLTPDYIEEIRQELPPAKFLNFMSSYRASAMKRNKTALGVDNLTANWTNPMAWTGKTKDQINQGFDTMVEEQKQFAAKKGIQLSQVQAETLAANSAPHAIPKFLENITNAMTSGDPNLMMEYAGALETIQSRGGQRVKGLDKNVFALQEAFKHFLNQGYTKEQAAPMAKQMVLDEDKQQAEITEKIIANWRKKNANDGKQTLSWARNIAGISKSTKLMDGDGFAYYLKDIFEDNMRYTKGNEVVATNMLQSALRRNWGITTINGDSEFTIYPLEKVLELEDGANPLIQEDIYEQLKVQFEANKSGFDSGHFPYYYRLKDRVSFNDYLKARKVIDEYYGHKDKSFFKFGKSATDELNRIQNFEKAQATIKEFMAAKPNIVEIVHSDDTIEEYPIQVRPSTFMTVSEGEYPVIGDYYLDAVNKSGTPIVLWGTYLGQQNHPVYRPDIRTIKSRFFDIHGIVGANPEEQWAALQFQQEQEQELARKTGGMQRQFPQAAAITQASDFVFNLLRGKKDNPNESSLFRPEIKGNINLNNRPKVINNDGSISTIRTIGVSMDGLEYVIPTVSDDGKILSNEEAIDLFRKTKKHFGAFKTIKEATDFAEYLHKKEEEKIRGKK